jgi:hypothetical protein
VQLHRQLPRAAVSNTRRVCAGVKPMFSQNASTASASPRRDRRQHRAQTRRCSRRHAGEFRRQRVRAEERRAHVDAELTAERRATRSIFASFAASRP